MQIIITLMAAGTAVLNALFALGIVLLCKAQWRTKLTGLLQAHGRLIIFLLTLVSVAGTLWMQYFANLPPCVLCWWQRVCMYPMLVISGVAVFKNTDLVEIADYILAFSILGALVSFYQHLMQMLPQGSLIPCSATDECAVRSVFEFGYITIPWMALSVFAVFILIAAIGRKKVSA